MGDDSEKTPEELKAEAVLKSDDWRPPFIPRGYDDLNPHIYRNIFYSTSNTDAFRDPKTHTRNPLIHKMARSKSVQEIHDINKSRKFKRNEAPLYQRSMCAYTQQFVPRPLDGVQINKECYNLFKEKCEAGNTSSTSAAESATETTTRYSFPQYSFEESMKALPPNFKPKQQKHVSDENKLMVTESSLHREFPAPRKGDHRTAPFKPAKQSHLAVGTFQGVTSYNTCFAPSKYDSVWPVKFAGQARPPPATTGYTGIIALDENEEKVLIPEEFHIGDVTRYGPC